MNVSMTVNIASTALQTMSEELLLHGRNMYTYDGILQEKLY